MKSGIKLVAASSLVAILALAPLDTARAFFTDPVSAMYEMSNNMVNAMLQLSTDIGTMADRIGDMADRIVETEDKIGEMADRIVATEELLAGTLLQLHGAAGTTSAGDGVLMLAPMTGAVVSRTQAPTITLSAGGTDYLLYVSDAPDFSSADTVPLLVNQQTDLHAVWHVAMEIVTGDVAYLAVRGVDANQRISGFSNAVRVSLQ